MAFPWRMWRRRSSSRPVARRAIASRPLLEALEDRCLLSAAFVQTNLVSDVAGLAQVTDANLINPWGLTAGPGGPFWVANDVTGTSTLYNGQGQPQSLIVNIPGSTAVNGRPTGDVFNTSGKGFTVSEGSASGSSIFLFDTLDGTISGWNPGVNLNNAIVEVHNPGALYTGLAIGTNASGQTQLYAANLAQGTIDVFDSNFHAVTTSGRFTDANLPSDFAPFNIQNINGQLYVEYTKVNTTTGLPAAGAGNGIVDVFSTDGKLEKRLITGGALNDPWGVALAPSNFGVFSNDLLVGNFGSGTINAFNAQTGAFVGQMKTSSGQPFQEEHLWAIRFGNGGAAGAKNTLFFTAGLTSSLAPSTLPPHGLFGSLQAEPKLAAGSPTIPNLGKAIEQTVSTIPGNGDVNPYGVAFVPPNYTGGGTLQAGDILVSNFNNSSNIQGTGSTIVDIHADGSRSVFFQGQPGLGLTTALAVLPQGFVLVGNTPSTVQNGTPTVQNGSLLVLDSSGNVVTQLTDSALLQGPWDMTVHTSGNQAQVFVSNVLSGTVTRIDLLIPQNGTPTVESETQIASGYTHRTDPAALVVGPTGLVYDPKNGTLYVASTGDNAIYAIANAATVTSDRGTGKLITSDSTHLHGPLGMALDANGDLIVANGDAVNQDPNHLNEIAEFTTSGQFVGQFQLDSGAAGGAFGLALQSVGGQTRFAAVDDDTNTLDIFTLDPVSGHHHHHHHR